MWAAAGGTVRRRDTRGRVEQYLRGLLGRMERHLPPDPGDTARRDDDVNPSSTRSGDFTISKNIFPVYFASLRGLRFLVLAQKPENPV
jgi:hypothetical protein